MDEVEEIKQRLDVVEIISGYLTLKKAGAYYKAPCPFHNEKTPSFMVSPERQSYKCFGCGEGGDIFTFIEKMEGVDFFNALKILADKAGVQIKTRAVKRGQVEYRADRKTRLYEINDLAKRAYQRILSDHPKAEKARQYLDGRGLAAETIKKFEIGYAPDSWDFLVRFLKKHGFSEEEMREAGVVIRTEGGKYFDRFRGRIMFPVNNIMGNAVAFTSRVLEENGKEAKYLNSSDSSIYIKGEIIYGLDKAKMSLRQGQPAVVVEGQMDVIACHQAGFTNVVASSGTALTELQLKILSRYTSEIIFSFDGDAAGQTAMKRVIALAVKQDIAARIVALNKPFKDPDEAIKADPKNWADALKKSRPAIEYWIDLISGNRNDLTNSDKKKIEKEILPVIKSVYSEIEKEQYLHYLSACLVVSIQSLAADMAKLRDASNTSTESNSLPKPDKLTPTKRLLAYLWHSAELLKNVPDSIRQIDLWPEGEIFSEMIKSGKIDRATVSFQEKAVLDQYALTLGADIDLNDNEATKDDFLMLLARIKKEKEEQIKAQIAAKLYQAESSGDRAAIKKWLSEYAELIK